MSVVWTNGCFDVLHRGHIEMLAYAKSLGDFLYVGIDSDKKVKQDKGPSRPFNTQEDRKYLLEALQHVDKVILFDSREGLEKNIETLKPDILVIGGDWKGKTVVGAQHAGEVKFFERIDGYSTTGILEKNENLC